MRQPGKAALTFGPTLGRIGWKEPHAYLGEGSGGSSLRQKWADCARAVVGLEESEQGQTSQAGVRGRLRLFSPLWGTFLWLGFLARCYQSLPGKLLALSSGDWWLGKWCWVTASC